VPCKERISNKDFFRFSIVPSGIYPTQDVTALVPKKHVRESIEYIAAYLNSKLVFNWLSTKGIIKGNIVEFSEKPIASIPFIAIDWSKENQKIIHDKITELVANGICHSSIQTSELNLLFQQLIEIKNDLS
jgi:adenine-specific DNA-methyltransferase